MKRKYLLFYFVGILGKYSVDGQKLSIDTYLCDKILFYNGKYFAILLMGQHGSVGMGVLLNNERYLIKYNKWAKLKIVNFFYIK